MVKGTHLKGARADRIDLVHGAAFLAQVGVEIIAVIAVVFEMRVMSVRRPPAPVAAVAAVARRRRPGS